MIATLLSICCLVALLRFAVTGRPSPRRGAYSGDRQPASGRLLVGGAALLGAIVLIPVAAHWMRFDRGEMLIDAAVLGGLVWGIGRLRRA